MTLRIPSATHVVFHPPADRRLLKIGAANVVRAFDTLIIGPCRRDPAEHARARRAWWHTRREFDRLYKPKTHWEPPIVVWAAASIAERVNLWRTCSWLRHRGIATRDVSIIELDPTPFSNIPDEPPPPFDGISSVAHHPDNVLLERLRSARPWPSARYERAVRLWDQFVDSDPSRFVRSCRRGVEGFPELAPLWTFLSAFFPRRTGRGALYLSRFDELLLTVLSDQWMTPLDVYVHQSQAGDELQQWFLATGDLFTDYRLAQWAQHASGAVERAPGPKPPGHPMLSSVYRLTDAGKRLRDGGLQQLTDAPALPIGGIEAYAPSSSWIVAEGGRLLRL
ncbi:MAG: DUF1835 domain-containing protein [Polyangiaceae bacterium]